MKAIHYKYTTKPIAIICALLLFTAVFYWPSKYYIFLRIAIFLGAILVVIPHNIKQLHWTVIFCIIAVIFNPIFPIYLHNKSHWIPVDIASGILFLLEVFVTTKPKKEDENKTSKGYSRDKLY